MGEFLGNDRFRIVKTIGTGGMGVVYEAIDLEQDTTVALKTLQQLHAIEIYRFKQEFRSLANIVHPNLVRMYEMFSDGHEWFYTMELIDGTDFRSWVRGGGHAIDQDGIRPEPNDSVDSISEGDRMRRGLTQLISGLEALHQAGKLHRDIKPSNTLVWRDGRVVLLDFGLVKDIGEVRERVPRKTPNQLDEIEYTDLSMATDGNVSGSILYMAPEQSEGNALTEASDWYAVGTMLFELLTDRLPFEGKPAEILTAKQTEAPPHPRDFIGDLPEELADACFGLISPSPETRLDALEDLKHFASDENSSAPSVTFQPTDVRLPFVGRDEHLAKIIGAFESVGKGGTSMLHLHGLSGYGKSALANRFLKVAEDQSDAFILVGRCYEQESVPYKALDGLVDSLGKRLAMVDEEILPPNISALAKIFPVLEKIDAIERMPPSVIADPLKLRRVAFDALAELFRRLGRRYKLVLYIDDLQWGDGDSAIFFRKILSADHPPEMLLIASYRSEYLQSSPCLQALPNVDSGNAENVAIREIEVGPLTGNESEELATMLLGERTNHRDVARIARESRGNPYFVHELARVANLDSAERIQDSTIDLDKVLWKRVSNLDETPRSLLEAIAVSGRPIPFRAVYEAIGVSPSGQKGAELLRSGNFIRRTGPRVDDEVESFHDRIRETILHHLDSDRKQMHHLGLARSLEAAGEADPETIGIHYRGGGNNERASVFYEQAAEQAMEALAFDRAATLFRTTLSLLDPEREEKRRLHVRLAEALGNAGRGAESATVYLEAAADSEPAEAIRLKERAGYQYCISGRIDEGRECFREVLRHIGLELPSTRRKALVSVVAQRLYLLVRGTKFKKREPDEIPPRQLNKIDISWAVAGGITVIDPVPAADFQTHNLILALRAGEPFRIARALAWEGSHNAMLGQKSTARTERLLGEAQELASDLNEPMVTGTVDLARCVAAFFLSDFSACRQYGDRAAQLFRERCAGATWELDQSQTFAYWACYWLGDISELSDRQSSLLSAAEERGAELGISQLVTFGGPFVWMARDDTASAKAALGKALEHWKDVEYQVYHYTALTAKTQLALYDGESERALAMMDEEWPKVRGAMLLFVEIVKAYMHFLRARCALAVVDRNPSDSGALAIARNDAGVLSKMTPTWARSAALQISAALSLREGNREEARDLLESAIQGFDLSGFQLHAWCARHRLTELLADPEREEESRAVEEWMASQGIVNPAAMADVNAPGFAYSDSLTAVKTE